MAMERIHCRSVAEYAAWAQAQPDFANYADSARQYMQSVGAVRVTGDG